jgi:hypothetical protein
MRWAFTEAVLLKIRIGISLILHRELESFIPVKTLNLCFLLFTAPEGFYF